MIQGPELGRDHERTFLADGMSITNLATSAAVFRITKAVWHWGISGFDAKRLAGIDTATGARGSDKRSPSGGTPDPIAGRRKAASKGVVALPVVLNRGAPVWLARLSRLPGQAGAARFDACQIEQTPTAAARNVVNRISTRNTPRERKPLPRFTVFSHPADLNAKS